MNEMRCDSCHALRWYGAPLQQFSLVEDRRAHVYHLCEVCAEARMIAFHHFADDGDYAPRMHPPARLMQ